jgi:hypothetical protein
MRLRQFIPILLLLATPVVSAQTTPLALTAHVEALGNGSDGTVMGIVFQIAPEDRERAGERVRAVTTLRQGDEIVDRGIPAPTLSKSTSQISTALPPVRGSERLKFCRLTLRSKPLRAHL